MSVSWFDLIVLGLINSLRNLRCLFIVATLNFLIKSAATLYFKVESAAIIQLIAWHCETFLLLLQQGWKTWQWRAYQRNILVDHVCIYRTVISKIIYLDPGTGLNICWPFILIYFIHLISNALCYKILKYNKIQET